MYATYNDGHASDWFIIDMSMVDKIMAQSGMPVRIIDDERHNYIVNDSSRVQRFYPYIEPQSNRHIPNEDAISISRSMFPHWNGINTHQRLMNASCIQMLLGPDLQSKVSFLVCHVASSNINTEGGRLLKIAEAHDIEVYNMVDAKNYEKMFRDVLSPN